MNMLLRNSALPQFVMAELNKDPDKFIDRISSKGVKNLFSGFEASVKKEIEAGTIRSVDARQLFINMISMLVFPFVGRPIIQLVAGIDKKAFRLLMQERRDHIKLFIRSSLLTET